MQKPSVGRMIHYTSYGTPRGEYTSQCRAAVVTEVDDPQGANADLMRVGLCVLNPTGLFFHPLAAGGCKYDGTVTEIGGNPTGQEHAGGTWHWPELVNT
jgi:hypothetical protein